MNLKNHCIFAFMFILINTNHQCQSNDSLQHRKYSSHSSYLQRPSKFGNDLDALLGELDASEEETEKKPHQLADTFLRAKKNKHPTCSSKFKQETNVIVDSKASIKNGAELLMPIRYVSKETAEKGHTAMHDACMQVCCETNTCDTALLSMKVGGDGYRCYLFKCDQNCFFLRHTEYVVMRMRTSEQLNDPEIEKPKITSKVSTFTNKPTIKNNYNAEMMGGGSSAYRQNDLTSNLGNKDKIYFTDKSLVSDSSSNIALAVFLLVLGVSLVMMLFVYLFLNTKYVNRRLNRLKSSDSKNVDVDADYLINGMYL